MAKNFSSIYREIQDEDFPQDMEIHMGKGENQQILRYKKTTWKLEEGEKGLRYGENPDQGAALYHLVDGGFSAGGTNHFPPNSFLSSQPELLQSGKHPSKINITDTDAALGILRWFDDPACAIIKHNNPCGVALAGSIGEAFSRAYHADRVAAFGGCVGLNRILEKETAEKILDGYVEVVLAPDFEEGVMGLFAKKPNVRVLRIPNIEYLRKWADKKVLEWKTLADGGLIAQWSFVPQARKPEDFYPAETVYKGQTYTCDRQPNESEWKDIIFGWLVESGVTSNSVIYVKDQVTVGIGTGEQDRVGVAEIARDKAYRKLQDRLSWEAFSLNFSQLTDQDKKREIEKSVKAMNGGLKGAVMVSDAFFPFRDGIDIGLNEGVSAVVQPGGSLRDFESIQACNEKKSTMVFTGQRSFRH